jgi:hypothetical protein
MRINARLDEDRKRKLEYLMRATGSRVSDIVKQAIDALYERAERSRGRPEKLLTSSGFVGCGESREELSVQYKDELKETIPAKQGHH